LDVTATDRQRASQQQCAGFLRVSVKIEQAQFEHTKFLALEGTTESQ